MHPPPVFTMYRIAALQVIIVPIKLHDIISLMSLLEVFNNRLSLFIPAAFTRMEVAPSSEFTFARVFFTSSSSVTSHTAPITELLAPVKKN